MQHTLAGQTVFLFGATADPDSVPSAKPGDITGQRHGAVRVQCATGGSVWISHMKAKSPGAFKLPATSVPVVPNPPLFIRHGTLPTTFQEVWVTVDGGVAYVYSDFYNGAMATEQCRMLTAALQVRCCGVCRCDCRVVCLSSPCCVCALVYSRRLLVLGVRRRGLLSTAYFPTASEAAVFDPVCRGLVVGVCRVPCRR